MPKETLPQSENQESRGERLLSQLRAGLRGERRRFPGARALGYLSVFAGALVVASFAGADERGPMQIRPSGVAGAESGHSGANGGRRHRENFSARDAVDLGTEIAGGIVGAHAAGRNAQEAIGAENRIEAINQLEARVQTYLKTGGKITRAEFNLLFEDSDLIAYGAVGDNPLVIASENEDHSVTIRGGINILKNLDESLAATPPRITQEEYDELADQIPGVIAQVGKRVAAAADRAVAGTELGTQASIARRSTKAALIEQILGAVDDEFGGGGRGGSRGGPYGGGRGGRGPVQIPPGQRY